MDCRVGETIRLRAFFQDSDGAGVDPGTVTVDYTDESGNATTGQNASSGNITGERFFNLTPDAAGAWFGVFKSMSASVRDKHLPFLVIVEGEYTAARAANLDNLDAAVSSIPASSGAPVSYAPTAATIVQGDDESPGGEDYTDLAAHDEVYMQVGENSSNGIDFQITRGTSTITETPAAAIVVGQYSGLAAHEVDVYAWNYDSSSWDRIGTMRSRSDFFAYTFPLAVNNHDAATGEMKLRLLHSTTTYIPSHYIRVDYVSFEKSVGNSLLLQILAEQSAQLADIDVEVDRLHTDLTTARAGNLDNLDASVLSRSSHSAADVAALVPDADANATAAWTYAGGRTLSSFGTLVADTAAAVIAALKAVTTSGVTLAGSWMKYLMDQVALITSGSISTFQAVASDLSVSIYQGDDYQGSRILRFPTTGTEASFGDLSGKTIKVTVKRCKLDDDDALTEDFSVSGSSQGVTGYDGYFTLKLTDAQTALMQATNLKRVERAYPYLAQVVETDANRTIVDSTWEVLEGA